MLRGHSSAVQAVERWPLCLLRACVRGPSVPATACQPNSCTFSREERVIQGAGLLVPHHLRSRPGFREPPPVLQALASPTNHDPLNRRAMRLKRVHITIQLALHRVLDVRLACVLHLRRVSRGEYARRAEHVVELDVIAELARRGCRLNSRSPACGVAAAAAHRTRRPCMHGKAMHGYCQRGFEAVATLRRVRASVARANRDSTRGQDLSLTHGRFRLCHHHRVSTASRNARHDSARWGRSVFNLPSASTSFEKVCTRNATRFLGS